MPAATKTTFEPVDELQVLARAVDAAQAAFDAIRAERDSAFPRLSAAVISGDNRQAREILDRTRQLDRDELLATGDLLRARIAHFEARRVRKEADLDASKVAEAEVLRQHTELVDSGQANAWDDISRRTPIADANHLRYELNDLRGVIGRDRRALEDLAVALWRQINPLKPRKWA